MLLAAMLLSCANVFAQGYNSETLKGDVNGDGIVDVADIAAVIKILKDGGGVTIVNGYFYLGTTKPTADNYKALPGVEASYISIDEAIGTKTVVEAGQTLYMLCPTSWMVGKEIEIEDVNGNHIYFLEEIDDITINGYSIYKTNAWKTSSDATLKIQQHLSVLVGHGIDYESAEFTDTGRQLSDNMIVDITLDAGDYIFIKVDNRDIVNNIYIYQGPGLENWEFGLPLDAPILDGDYKCYKTTNRYNAGEHRYRINKQQP